MDVASKIGFLRECYREDHIRGGYWNVYASKVRQRTIFSGLEELANGFSERVDFPRADDFESVTSEVAVRAGEYELLYGFLHLVGSLRLPGSEQAVECCAPLFVFPCFMERYVGDPVVVLDTSSRRLNTGLIEVVAGGRAGELIQALTEGVSPGALTDRDVLEVIRILKEVPNLDLKAMDDYPALMDGSDLREVRRKRGDENSVKFLCPVSSLALWPKSEAGRGVVQELGEMAEAGSWSGPVKALLSDGTESRVGSAESDDRMSVASGVLSEAQELIVRSARVNPLTFVNGPPGTGKSFTIAAVALDHLAKGQSVLISAKTDEAVDVIAAKIEEDHGVRKCLVRGGKKQYLRKLKDELADLLGGQARVPEGALLEDERNQRDWEQLTKQLEEDAERLSKVRQFEEEIGQDFLGGTGLGAGIRRAWSSWRARRAVPMWRRFDEFVERSERKISMAGRVLEGVRNFFLWGALKHRRADLVRFEKALRSRRGTRKEEIFGETDFVAVLDAFPLWLVKLSDVERVLPLEAERFDLVILDEATQCDVAGAMPLLQRAKRAVIAGDPKQLRHVSFLSNARQAQLAERFGVDLEGGGLDYRNRSLLDLASERVSGMDAVGFLNEHYRSRPGIIGFSNREFYNESLHVMSERPWIAERFPVVLEKVDADDPGKAENREEVRCVLDHLRRLVADTADLPAERKPSVGIVSPFRVQVDEILRACSEELEAEVFSVLVRVHQLKVGTAYAFQGSERDVMFLSLALQAKGAKARLRYLEREDVFNVLITRAREKQVVITSLECRDLPIGSLLRRYLEYVEQEACAPDASGKPLLDPFADEVKAWLEGKGATVYGGMTVAGVLVDLVAILDGRTLAIDLIGYPSTMKGALSVSRYKMFGRAGMRVFPLPYSQWRVRREECQAAILRSFQ